MMVIRWDDRSKRSTPRLKANYTRDQGLGVSTYIVVLSEKNQSRG